MKTIPSLSLRPQGRFFRMLTGILSVAAVAGVGAWAQPNPGDSFPGDPVGPHNPFLREYSPTDGGDANSPWFRAREALHLAEQGKAEQALEHLVWCYDHGPSRYPDYVFALDGALPAQIAMLGRTYPPAIEMLQTRSTALRQKISADPRRAKPEMASQLAALHVALQDEAGILDTLKVLPKGKVLTAYGESVRPLLIATRHYREAVDIGSMESDFGRRRAAMYERFDAMRETRGDRAKLEPAMREATAMVGVLYVEALAGVGATPRAEKLMRDVLKIDDSAKIRTALEEALSRAGSTGIAVPGKK